MAKHGGADARSPSGSVCLSKGSGQSPSCAERPTAGEHRVEHLGGEGAGEGVLLTRVVRAQQDSVTGKWVLGEMAEAGSGHQPERPGHGRCGELAQRHQDPHVHEQRKLPWRYERHSSRSSGVGLLAGGAQRTAAVIHAPCSSSPSSTDALWGWLA